MALFELTVSEVKVCCLKKMRQISCEMSLIESFVDQMKLNLPAQVLEREYLYYILPTKLDKLDSKDKTFHEILLIYQAAKRSAGDTVWLDNADIILLDVL